MNWLLCVYHKCPIIIIHRHSFFEAFVWDICSSIRTMPGASSVTAIRWRFGSSRCWTIILTRTTFNWDVMMLKIRKLKNMFKSHEVTWSHLKSLEEKDWIQDSNDCHGCHSWPSSDWDPLCETAHFFADEQLDTTSLLLKFQMLMVLYGFV